MDLLVRMVQLQGDHWSGQLKIAVLDQKCLVKGLLAWKLGKFSFKFNN